MMLSNLLDILVNGLSRADSAFRSECEKYSMAIVGAV